MIPTWPPGCRRLTPGEGYLETLIQDHVGVIHGKIIRFTENRLVTATGEELNFDIIAYATGLAISYIPHIGIMGERERRCRRNGLRRQTPICVL
ncbi:uncharacterized protein A1O9_12980 [Exophiala aquamarina CBS 119918]|uniref:FAD/NAD(P)-binding domain-containing protein n=1 Tax=Exophiala aquamarina CBS 119918 TaxID=1182545 RepID=A0A072NUB8_9EURO|nr:uncharacterized protein A1O9_12980 [Exophiala aquamarina CBS 119918]KEF50962.1 hypothetical protein A1O9_12980 [Exophiala aquamarina CBS 119918]